MCIDTSKLFTFNNIAYIRDDCNVQYKDFKQYTSKVVNDFVQEVFYLGGVQDEEYKVRLLQHCGISGVNMSNLYDYINDTSTYNLVLEVVLDEIRTFLTDVIYENLNTDNLYKSTGEDTKGVFFINKRYLGVVAAYLNKMINEVVLPNSCQLEKCDNKNILNLLVKKAYPYKDIVTTRVGVHYYIKEESSCFREVYLLHLNTTKDMYTWVEDKHNLFYCIDINKLMWYNNLRWVGLMGTTRFDSVGISGELLRNTMNSITSSLNNTNLEVINRMLHFYGITDMDYESVQWLINDTHVYKAFETKLEEEVVIKSEKALQDFFDGVILNNTIKGRLFNNTKLPLMRYDTKSQKVYVPNRGDIVFVDFMSRTGDGKDGRDIFSVDDFLGGRTNLKDNDLLHIVTNNDYDITLGGAF